MKRLERALSIRNEVLEHGKEFGSLQWCPSGEALVVDRWGWHARIHTPFNPARGSRGRWANSVYRWFEPQYISDENGKVIGRELPYRMGLWLRHGPKVMTLQWHHSDADLISMRRGDWEAELFDLPPYLGSAGLQSYELHARRAKRW